MHVDSKIYIILFTVKYTIRCAANAYKTDATPFLFPASKEKEYLYFILHVEGNDLVT